MKGMKKVKQVKLRKRRNFRQGGKSVRIGTWGEYWVARTMVWMVDSMKRNSLMSCVLKYTGIKDFSVLVSFDDMEYFFL